METISERLRAINPYMHGTTADGPAAACIALTNAADTIDALVAALVKAEPWLPHGRDKLDKIHNQVDAALALARGEK